MLKKRPKDIDLANSSESYKLRYATNIDEFLGETCLPFMAGLLTVLGTFIPLSYFIQDKLIEKQNERYTARIDSQTY